MDLAKQVGPLPLGAWIAVVGGGLGLAYYSYRNNAAPTVVAPSTVESGATSGDGSVGGWTGTTPPPAGTTVAAPSTNQAWAVQCINWLIAQGYDATESDSAMRKYIAGGDPAPSIKEWMLIGLALQHFGSPPDPLPPMLTPPPTIPQPVITTPSDQYGGGVGTPAPLPPTPAPPPAAGNVRWYTVKAWPLKGSSLWTIAQIFYGNGSQYERIFNANRVGVRRSDGSMGMISNPNLVRPGWVLQIP